MDLAEPRRWSEWSHRIRLSNQRTLLPILQWLRKPNQQIRVLCLHEAGSKIDSLGTPVAAIAEEGECMLGQLLHGVRQHLK